MCLFTLFLFTHSQDAADIEKWRAERRKKSPTDTNAKKRQLEDEDRRERGQVASTPMYRVGKGETLHFCQFDSSRCALDTHSHQRTKYSNMPRLIGSLAAVSRSSGDI